MKNINVSLKITLLLIIFMSFISGCYVKNSNNFDTQDNSKILIVTTIFPFKEFAESIGKKNVQVIELIPSGIDPHNWEPTPSNIKNIEHSDIFIYVGSSLEPKIDNYVQQIKNKNKTKIFIKAENISEINYNKNKIDPHLWLDLDNDRLILNKIYKSIIKIDPNNKKYYYNNYKNYDNKLKDLEKKYQVIRNCSKKTFVVGGHSAFGYIAKKYNLTQITISGLSPDAEPSPKKVIDLLDVAKKDNIKYIIFEDMTNPKMSNIISEQANLQIITIDPAPTLNPNYKKNTTFINILDENLIKFKKILDCNK